jgi:AraC family transcriptional regulator
VFDASRCEVEFVDQLKIVDPEISAAMETLAREARERDKAEHLYVDAIATQISIQVLRRYSSLRVHIPKSSNGLRFAQEQRLARYIDERLHENLSVLQLCDVAGISPCHFVRLFKKSFGLPPHKYLVQKRLEQVCKLLKEGDTPLKRVASLCGFYDQAHMTRLFKENYHLTPKQFRDL